LAGDSAADSTASHGGMLSVNPDMSFANKFAPATNLPAK
jgi:hypothetical protein